MKEDPSPGPPDGPPGTSRARHRAALAARLDAALAAGDGAALVTLYLEAAARGGEAEAFHLTHARVHALEAADPREPAIRARLAAMGREDP